MRFIPLVRGVLASRSGNGIRRALEKGSVPRRDRERPNKPVSIPFARFLVETEAIIVSPTIARHAFSAGPKARVILAIKGENKTKIIKLAIPPINEATTAPPRAWPARPFFVIA